MPKNPAPPVAVSDSEVMASVDECDTGKQLIIAEISSDEAYVSMSTEETAVLENWR